MKWLFSKSKTGNKPATVTEKAAERLVGVVLRGQRKIADRLNQATAGWPVLRMRFALYLFCGLFGSGSAMILMNAISEPVQESKLSMPEPAIRMPVPLKTQDRNAIRQTELKELEILQERIDSLPADSIPPQLRSQFEELKKQMLNP